MKFDENYNNENVLEISNLSKNYDSFTLNKINFNVKKGSITGFIGINGSGKTTTIKSIAGLLIPDGGEIRFWGEAINTKNESLIRNRIGFLLDGNYYYPELTLKQMKNIFSNAYSNWDEKIFNELINKFELPLKQKISKLSKGMAIQYLLSLALSHHAEILIMDEPTSGLDPLVRVELMDILKDLAHQGISILFSSHITSDLENISDDIVLIHKGNILFQEKTKKLKEMYFVINEKIENLNCENKELFLNIRKDNDSFKGIYKGNKDEIIKAFPNASITTANVEDIMLGHIFGCGR